MKIIDFWINEQNELEVESIDGDIYNLGDVDKMYPTSIKFEGLESSSDDLILVGNNKKWMPNL